MRRALAGKILSFLTCMPAGDSTNEPHQEKKPSFFFQHAQSHGNTHQQPAAPRFNRTTRCSAGAFAEKKKKHQSKSVFSFPPEERCPSLSQGKMMAHALLQRKGAFSAPQRAWDGTTQQSKRNRTIGTKERKKRNNNQKVYFLFLLRRGHLSRPRKDDGARRCGEGAFSVPRGACDGKTQQTKLCCQGSFFIFISEPKPNPFSFQHVTIANFLEQCMSCCVTNYLLERCKFFR